MGNYMGMPTSTQVAFPPPPFPMPVNRPPIVPPMRQLEVGLGPPSPFEPGRTPLPVVLPSLATRAPLLQQDMNIQQRRNIFPPGGLAGQAPIGNIITANQINKQNVNQQQNLQYPTPLQQNNVNLQPSFIQMPNQAIIPNQQFTEYQGIIQPNAQNQNLNNQSQAIYQNQVQIEQIRQLQLQRIQQMQQMQPIIQQNIYPQQQYNNPFQHPTQIITQQTQQQFYPQQNYQNNVNMSGQIHPHSYPIIQNSSNIYVQPEVPINIIHQPFQSVNHPVQQTIIINNFQNNNPQPSIAYARSVQSVPMIPSLVLEAVNQLKESRQMIVDDSVTRGIQLPPYYIIQKQAYYQGEWINGLPGGYARIFYDSGAYFEGYFVNGQAFCKEGIWVYPDGSYYIGGIQHSTPNGLGQLTYRGSGMKYIGNWINGKPYGQGREEFQDGSFFQGTFINGVKQGIGKFIWADGSFYEGQFKNGFMQGHGVKQFSNGSKFIGQFKRNKLFGKGTYMFQRGQYKGQFVNNKREGVGIFKYSDGRVYIGEFKQDRQQGRGRMFIPTGQVIDGQWVNGKNIAIHNVSESTSISDISLDDLTFNSTNQIQIPNVPMTVSLEAFNSIQAAPLLPENNSNIQTNNFYYSANYRPPEQSTSFQQ